MKFCNQCFVDLEIKPIIEGLGQKEDNCPVCQNRNVFIYDTDRNVELTEYFDRLLDIYTPESMLPVDFPEKEKKLLANELTDRWKLFSNKLNSTSVYNIIRAICTEKYVNSPNLFNALIGIDKLNDMEFFKEHSLLQTNSWDDFVESVKRHNRFHTNHINLEILVRYCSFIRKVYKKGSVFYRGRISSAQGFTRNEMGAPPPEKATAGRANSTGISCLYLANDRMTTIHEIRAGAFDYVSVGRFELTQDIVVVDLKAIDRISPFFEGIDILEDAINKEHLQRINMEIGRTLRRSDSVLDYIPTQFIADFIKSISYNGRPEYSGIEYNSTIRPGGQNLAIFYPDLFVCNEVNVIHIERLDYKLPE